MERWGRSVWGRVHVGSSWVGGADGLDLVSKQPPMRKGEERHSRGDERGESGELRSSLLAAGVFNQLELNGVGEEPLDPDENHLMKTFWDVRFVSLDK